MPKYDRQPDTLSFSNFTVDLRSGELRKHGHKIRIQEKPFQILALLLKRPGEAVTKEEIRTALWSTDTFVDFDHSIATAIGKLRDALGDSFETPQFVETVGRRGYRFIATVIAPASEPVPQSSLSHPVSSESTVGQPSSLSVNSWLETAQSPSTASKARWFRYAGPAIAVLLLAGTLAGYLRHRSSVFRFTPQGTVVLADFSNSTGEVVFDGALKQGLNVGLEPSPMIQILSDEKSAAILKQMGHPADQPISGSIAIELCQRTGSQVTVQGSVSSLGSAYLIGLTAIRCENGEPFAHEQVEARRKEDVIDALGKATDQLRARLGESLPSIQKYAVPLEQATTPSLEALKAYSQAVSTQEKLGDPAAVPFFERAIELDPNFALAYGDLGAAYDNLHETALARRNVTKAYELRDRVTEFERLSIESWYHIFVTGDLQKASEVLEIKRQIYPRASRSLNDLGEIYATLGLFDKEVGIGREALGVDPFAATTYGNLAVSLMALGRMDEAGTVLAEASNRGLQTEYLMEVNYWRAFARGDSEEIRRLVARAAEVPGAPPILLAEQANAAAYSGHVEKARQLSIAAANVSQNEKQEAAAGLYLAQIAVREAEIGDSASARDFILRALNLTQDQRIITLAALVTARTGNVAQARSMAEKMDKEFPKDTLIQKYWLPTIRAELELRQGKPAIAIRLLSIAEPFDSAAPEELFVSTLYPAYVRGQAYLLGGDGEKSASEFQKLLDHPGMVLTYPLGALARLGHARALRLAGDGEAARKEYNSFFALWKDADPNIPILMQAKLEYAKL